MRKVSRNEVDFSEIFYFADEKFGISWNHANDVFFNNSLDYKSHNEFNLNEPLERLEDGEKIANMTESEKAEWIKNEFPKLSDDDKGYFIINEFMIANNVDNIWVDNG